jgi:hypothetical protein
VIPLRSREEIASRLELGRSGSVLLVDCPRELGDLVEAAAGPAREIRTVEAATLRSVKGSFDLVLLWWESRVGARAVLEAAAKRLAPGGRLWAVTALRKVTGPRTPALHRLDRSDLEKALGRRGLTCDREARLSAWHAAYGFVEGGSGEAAGRPSHST